MDQTSGEWTWWTFRKKSYNSPICIPELIPPTRCATRVSTQWFRTWRFFLQATPQQYDIISGEPPPPKVVGSVNLYTEEFFSLMNSRLKEGGIATFWLPINQLKVDEAKAILRAFHNAFPNASVWTNADEQWIMMGIKGRNPGVKKEQIAQLWS